MILSRVREPTASPLISHSRPLTVPTMSSMTLRPDSWRPKPLITNPRLRGPISFFETSSSTSATEDGAARRGSVRRRRTAGIHRGTAPSTDSSAVSVARGSRSGSGVTRSPLPSFSPRAVRPTDRRRRGLAERPMLRWRRRPSHLGGRYASAETGNCIRRHRRADNDPVAAAATMR